MDIKQSLEAILAQRVKEFADALKAAAEHPGLTEYAEAHATEAEKWKALHEGLVSGAIVPVKADEH